MKTAGLEMWAKGLMGAALQQCLCGVAVALRCMRVQVSKNHGNPQLFIGRQACHALSRCPTYHPVHGELKGQMQVRARRLLGAIMVGSYLHEHFCFWHSRSVGEMEEDGGRFKVS